MNRNILTDIVKSLGFQWKDDNPKQKPHYEGDIIVTIGGVGFSNSDNGYSMTFYAYLHDSVIGFSNIEELVTIYKVLNKWKQPDIEVFTFDEFVEYAAKLFPEDAARHDGFAWSFSYKGYPVTHENNACYLIGDHRFTDKNILISGFNNEVLLIESSEFQINSNPKIKP